MSPEPRIARLRTHLCTSAIALHERRAEPLRSRVEPAQAHAYVRPVSKDPRHELGNRGEQLAADHLKRLGYAIVTRNHRTRFGELDIVALADTLVFVEVKTRSGSGSPFESLHARKRAQVRRMAASYLAENQSHRYAENIRFDAIGIVFDASGRLTSLEHLEGAF